MSRFSFVFGRRSLFSASLWTLLEKVEKRTQPFRELRGSSLGLILRANGKICKVNLFVWKLGFPFTL